MWNGKTKNIKFPIVGKYPVPRSLTNFWSQIRNISMVLLLVVYMTSP